MTPKKHLHTDISDPARDQKRLESDPSDETLAETNDSKISPLDKEILKDSFDPSYDVDLPVGSVSLDALDDDNEPLNEGNFASDLFGEDLDDDLVDEEDEEDGD